MLQDGLLLRHLDDALRTKFQLCNEKQKKIASIKIVDSSEVAVLIGEYFF